MKKKHAYGDALVITLVPVDGFEPPTTPLRTRALWTSELHGHISKLYHSSMDGSTEIIRRVHSEMGAILLPIFVKLANGGEIALE